MSIYRLQPAIQNYQWGDLQLLPQFLGEKPNGEPWAELWLGTHSNGETLLVEQEQKIPLSRFLENHGYNKDLPYLFKILAIASPLSLQVHPDRGWAEQRFAEEEAEGVPITAPHRLYKDANHKPEIIMAITPLTAMCGFREEQEIRNKILPLFDSATSMGKRFLQQLELNNNFFLATFQTLMRLPEEDKISLIQWALAHTTGEEGALLSLLHERYPGDIGVLAPLYLQIIHLQPGEALFQAAREIHAYVAGMGVERMANSDNVIRAGLTPKHVDVPELLRVVDFSYHKKEKILGVSTNSRVSFPVNGVDDFVLSTIQVSSTIATTNTSGVEIWLSGGDMTIVRGEQEISLTQGEALLVLPDKTPLEVCGEGFIYTAGIPSVKNS